MKFKVMETMRIILGKEPLLGGHLLKIDGGTMTFHRFRLSRRKDCPVCNKDA